MVRAPANHRQEKATCALSEGSEMIEVSAFVFFVGESLDKGMLNQMFETIREDVCGDMFW